MTTALTPPTPQRAWIGRGLGAIAIAWLMLRGFYPSVFAMVTNDSIGYVSWSRALRSGGLIGQGYRQFGYPLWIRFVDEIRFLFGWDRLFAVAMLQRVILVVALAIIWRALRWWSLPLAILATAGTLVVITNFVLTEGLAIPLALLFSAFLVELVIKRDSNSRMRFVVFVVLSAATLLSLTFIKVQFAALFPLFVAVIALPENRARFTKAGMITAIVVPAGIIGLFILAISFENFRELGVFEPVSEKGRAEYYGAWQAVFQVREADPSDPDLAPFFDGGNLHRFVHDLEAIEPDYVTRKMIFDERIEDLFAAAGTDTTTERGLAILGALRGGRTDDIHSLVDRALKVSQDSLDDALESNSIGSSQGAEVVLERVNLGDRTLILTSANLAPSVTGLVADHRPWRGLISIGALILSLGGVIFAPTIRWVAAASVAAVVAISLALGVSYIDNARYLIPSGLVTCTVATLVVVEFVHDKFPQLRRTEA